MALVTECDPALDAYQTLAPFYDRYTSSYDHRRWLDSLEAIARAHGLIGNRLLDVACGTGKSFAPMLERGYEVVACDLSPAMVECAQARAGDAAEVLVADMRELPLLGSFDLVTCLDDALNYLLSEAELAAALAGMAANLRPGGILVFDLNSLATYGAAFARDAMVECDGTVFRWSGEGAPDPEPGCVASATIEVLAAGDGCAEPVTSRHVQRHHPEEEVVRSLLRAGLEPIERRGQVTGERVELPGDERRHVKLVHFARRRADRLSWESEWTGRG